MTILDELLDEIKSDDNLDQIRQLCDTILEEEKGNIKNPKLMVKGSNVFLCLEVPGRTQKEIAFLTLERESKDVYLAVLWTYQKAQVDHKLMGQSERMAAEYSIAPKRSRVWKIEDDRPKKILIEYAKVIKYLKGE